MIVFASGGLATNAHAASEPPETTARPELAALSIGTLEISNRQLERNLRRLKGQSSDDHSPLGPDVGTQRALERYLVEQVLTAAAFAQGYAARPEMQALKARLERHRLTHLNGPLYEQLGLSVTAISEDQMTEWIEKLHSTKDLTIIRFPESAPIAGMVRQAVAEKNEGLSDTTIAWLRESGQARVYQGILAWPYLGFESAADFLEVAPIGRWSAFRTADGIDYRVMVRSTRTRSLPPRVADEEASFRRSVARLGAQAAYLRRRTELLAAAQLSYDWAFASSFLTAIRSRADRENIVSAQLLSEVDAHHLATFHADGGEIVLTAAGFAERFNNRMVRRLPVNEFELYEAVRELAQEELDYREACARGLRSVPAFQEDHESLFAYQVLDFFEKEVVRPAIVIEPGEIARYYQENQGDFSRAEWVGGRLYGFDDARSASLFALSSLHADSVASGSVPAGAASAETKRLTPQASLPGWPGPAEIPFRLNAPRLLGPYPWGSQMVVWVRDQQGPAVVFPLIEVQAEIRALLLEKKLPAAEADLARSLCRSLTVCDRIDYGRYTPSGGVRRPW